MYLRSFIVMFSIIFISPVFAADTCRGIKPVCGTGTKCLKTISQCIGGAFVYTFLENIVCVTASGDKVEYQRESFGGGTTGATAQGCENSRDLVLTTWDSCK